jgi:hypothetical protein
MGGPWSKSLPCPVLYLWYTPVADSRLYCREEPDPIEPVAAGKMLGPQIEIESLNPESVRGRFIFLILLHVLSIV